MLSNYSGDENLLNLFDQDIATFSTTYNEPSHAGFWLSLAMTIIASLLMFVVFVCCGLLFYLVSISMSDFELDQQSYIESNIQSCDNLEKPNFRSGSGRTSQVRNNDSSKIIAEPSKMSLPPDEEPPKNDTVKVDGVEALPMVMNIPNLSRQELQNLIEAHCHSVPSDWNCPVLMPRDASYKDNPTSTSSDDTEQNQLVQCKEEMKES